MASEFKKIAGQYAWFSNLLNATSSLEHIYHSLLAPQPHVAKQHNMVRVD